MSSDESSVKSSSTPSSSDLQCKVCGFPGHGLHFGVITCRACAAFFRRFIVLDLKYKCLNNKTRCSLDRIRRSSCRHCRFQKCLQMGMSSNNVQWHRDVNAIDKKFKKLKSQEPSDEDEDPSVPSTSKPKETVENKETLNRQSSRFTVDYDSIEIEVQRIFRTDFPSTSHEHFGSFGPLHKFTEWLKMIRKLQKSKEIVFENRLTEEFLIPHWKEQAKNIAVLFMHCTVFREFSLMEKCRFFKKLWKSVYRIDKIHTSVEVFGDDFVNEKILVISSDRAIQMNDLFFDFDWISDDELEAMLQSVLDYSDKLISVIGRPLCQLNLSIEEFSFLILNFMFSNEEQIPECFIELRDKFLHSISDELHDYYQKNNVLNYASRISNIMKVVHAMRKIHHDDLAGIFVDFKKRVKNKE